MFVMFVMSVSDKQWHKNGILIVFELYFLQPVLGSQPVLSSHLAIPPGWPPNTGVTILMKSIISW